MQWTNPQAVAGQLGQVQGGNPLLQPEKAKTYSFGLLFAPRVVPNLNGTLDFWQIRLDQVVGPLPASVALAQCLASGNPAYCALIVRDRFFSLSGATLAGGGYFIQTNQNIAAGLTSGIDVQTNYKLQIGHAGSLVWNLNGAYLLHAVTQPLTGGP